MSSVMFFFFQAEDGIRDADVTGVQTCALPISGPPRTQPLDNALASVAALHAAGVDILAGTDAGYPGTAHGASMHGELARSEERRVGKECRCRWSSQP